MFFFSGSKEILKNKFPASRYGIWCLDEFSQFSHNTFTLLCSLARVDSIIIANRFTGIVDILKQSDKIPATTRNHGITGFVWFLNFNIPSNLVHSCRN